MPTFMTPMGVLTWFVLALSLGTGWHLGAWLVARLLR